jgi:hypothetical protein
MPETAFDRDLAQAAINVIEQRDYGHPAIHPMPIARLVAEILPPLAAEHRGMIPGDHFNEAIRKAANDAQLGDKSPDDLKTILRAYRLVRPEQDSYRILGISDVESPWLGFEEVADERLSLRERFRRFAHLHMLAYPELLEAIVLLAPPGRREGDIERALRDRFAFTRKINATIAAYLIDVARSFELASTQGKKLRNVWAPPTVLAALVVRRYLELTDFALDRGIETADLLRQCAAVIPGMFFRQHPAETQWYRALRAPVDICLREVGGAQLRIRLDGLLWLARAGLLAPLQCARVLRERRAKDSLTRLRQRLLDRVRSFLPSPVNANEIETELSDAP